MAQILLLGIRITQIPHFRKQLHAFIISHHAQGDHVRPHRRYGAVSLTFSHRDAMTGFAQIAAIRRRLGDPKRLSGSAV